MITKQLCACRLPSILTRNAVNRNTASIKYKEGKIKYIKITVERDVEIVNEVSTTDHIMKGYENIRELTETTENENCIIQKIRYAEESISCSED